MPVVEKTSTFCLVLAGSGVSAAFAKSTEHLMIVLLRVEPAEKPVYGLFEEASLYKLCKYTPSLPPLPPLPSSREAHSENAALFALKYNISGFLNRAQNRLFSSSAGLLSGGVWKSLKEHYSSLCA